MVDSITPANLKRHNKTIMYYNGLVALIPQLKEGTTKYMELIAKINQAQAYIERDLKEASQRAEK